MDNSEIQGNFMKNEFTAENSGVNHDFILNALNQNLQHEANQLLGIKQKKKLANKFIFLFINSLFGDNEHNEHKDNSHFLEINNFTPFHSESAQNKFFEKNENNKFLFEISHDGSQMTQEHMMNFPGIYPPDNNFSNENNEKKKTKGSFKNTYINKINHLMENIKNKNVIYKEMVHRKEVLTEMKFSPDKQNSEKESLLDIDYNQLSELEKINYKLAKNRESARNSRKRKKMYFEMLESKVVELSDELKEAKNKIKDLEENQDKLFYHSRIFNGLLNERKNLYDRLEKASSEKKEDNSEMNLIIDSLQLRFGVTGRERLAIIDFLFKKIIEALIPPYLRYLLATASQNQKNLEKDFEKINVDKWKNLTKLEKQDSVLQNLFLTNDQKAYIPKFQKKFLNSYNKYKSLLESLNQIRKELQQEAHSLAKISDEYGKVLKKEQIAALLLSVEKDPTRNLFSSVKLFLPNEDFGTHYDQEEEEFLGISQNENNNNQTKEEPVKKKRPYNKKKKPKLSDEEINF